MLPILIFICVAISVSGIVYAVSTLFATDKTAVENRLSALTRHVNPFRGKEGAKQQSVTKSLNETPGFAEKFLSRFLNIQIGRAHV